MSKTPYELRHELLMMAQGILSEQNINERIRIENDWNMKCEQIRFNAERHGDALIFPDFPKVPQYDARLIIAVANQLNEFVSKTS